MQVFLCDPRFHAPLEQSVGAFVRLQALNKSVKKCGATYRDWSSMQSCCSSSTVCIQTKYILYSNNANVPVWYDMPIYDAGTETHDDDIDDNIEMLKYHDVRGAIGLAASQHLHGWRCSWKRFQAGSISSNLASWATGRSFPEDGETIFAERRRTSQARPDYGDSAGGEMLGGSCRLYPTSYQPKSSKNAFVVRSREFFLPLDR